MTSVAVVPHAPAQIARATIAHHSKSFALASRLLGRRVRDQTAVVYTWCRRADDAIDELVDPTGDRLDEALARLAAELDGAYAGTSSDPVLAAFGEVAQARQIPRHYPDELLAGMAMDARDTRYATLDQLRMYAWRVAGVVGLMMSHVFGVKDDAALVHAAHLGIAMQLTNICRDVAEDWERGRLYLPDELLAQHGAADLASDLGGPLSPRARDPIARTVRELLAIADLYYRSGDRGVRSLPWRAAGAVMAARRVYAAIGERIRRADHDVTAGRAVVTTPAKLALVAGALGRLVVSAPRRLLSSREHIPTRTLRFEDVPTL
jgi:phytoene synthase